MTTWMDNFSNMKNIGGYKNFGATEMRNLASRGLKNVNRQVKSSQIPSTKGSVKPLSVQTVRNAAIKRDRAQMKRTMMKGLL